MLDTLFQSYDRLFLFDTETTGLQFARDEIIEFAAIVVERQNGEIVVTEEYDQLIALSPGGFVPPFIQQLTGISNEDLRSHGIPKTRLCCDIARMITGNTLLLAYNAQFDLSFLYYLLLRDGDATVLRGKDKLDLLTVYRDRRSYPHKLCNAIESYGLIYNKTLLNRYCALDGAVIADASEINSFETLKAVAEDIQRRKEEVGVLGTFASAGMDASSDWRFKTHLVNLPLYYEYRDRGISSAENIQGLYLSQFRQIWDLYLNNATCPPAMIGARTGEDAASEFALGEAVFYQNGTWAYADATAEGVTGDELAFLPIYIGAPGEETQGLCTGSENYWCLNRRADPQDIEATLAFVNWLSSTQEGLAAMTETLGLRTPFANAPSVSANALITAAQEDLDSGRTPVSWVFPTIPSDRWKTNLGAAMLDYAQGTGDWAAVERAFVDGWAQESAAAQ